MTLRDLAAVLWDTRLEGAAILAVFATFYTLICVLGA